MKSLTLARSLDAISAKSTPFPTCGTLHDHTIFVDALALIDKVIASFVPTSNPNIVSMWQPDRLSSSVVVRIGGEPVASSSTGTLIFILG